MFRHHIKGKVQQRRTFDVIAIRKARRAIIVALIMHITREMGKVNLHSLVKLCDKIDLPSGSTYIEFVIRLMVKFEYLAVSEPVPPSKIKWYTLTEKGLLAVRQNIEGYEAMMKVWEIIKLKKNDLSKL